MLTRQLPEQINIKKLADNGATLDGVVDIRRLQRFAQALLVDDGQVVVSLEFSRNDDGIKLIQGTVKADVQQQCQRCLEPVTTEIEVTLNLAVAYDEEQAEALESRYEPLILDVDQVQLVDILEDDLLLALPMIPYHDISVCEANGYVAPAEEEINEAEPVETEEDRKENPFAVLAELKGQTKKH